MSVTHLTEGSRLIPDDLGLSPVIAAVIQHKLKNQYEEKRLPQTAHSYFLQHIMARMFYSIDPLDKPNTIFGTTSKLALMDF